jgi:hypothetical protein
MSTIALGRDAHDSAWPEDGRVVIGSAKPGLPDSTARLHRTMCHAGLKAIESARVFPLAVISSVTVWATESLLWIVPEIGCASATAKRPHEAADQQCDGA